MQARRFRLGTDIAELRNRALDRAQRRSRQDGFGTMIAMAQVIGAIVGSMVLGIAVGMLLMEMTMRFLEVAAARIDDAFEDAEGPRPRTMLLERPEEGQKVVSL
jgi:hypothetical protein